MTLLFSFNFFFHSINFKVALLCDVVTTIKYLHFVYKQADGKLSTAGIYLQIRVLDTLKLKVRGLPKSSLHGTPTNAVQHQSFILLN